MRIAVLGGGIAGLTATWQLSRMSQEVSHFGDALDVSLFESSSRLGGTIQTVREGGFVIESGPDGWLTAKPWASELAHELGLGGELIPSNDAVRKTWIQLRTPERPTPRLVPMPDGMTLMVPSDLNALAESPLFSPDGIAACHAELARASELRARIPSQDESVASFTLRHFGPELLERVAAPLLSGVFGGDVYTLSARAAMPALVQMERTHGSLIAALQAQRAATADGQPVPSIFTSLRCGVASLVDRLTAQVPQAWLHLNTSVLRLALSPDGAWQVTCATAGRRRTLSFDRVFLALPADSARSLLAPVDTYASALLPNQSSSAVLVAFAFPDAARVPIPPGFGLLVPPDGGNQPPAHHTPLLLQACTFADQKYAHRVPPGGRLLRAYFGGPAAARLTRCNNDEIAAIARLELARVLHTYTHADGALARPAPAPLPDPLITVVRRLPNSLPQYAVGHLDRMAELESRIATHLPGLAILGNALHGLGLPDVIRAARASARAAVQTPPASPLASDGPSGAPANFVQ